MKYCVEIEIALPREQVVELFDNENNLYCWQEGLQSMQLLSGEPGQTGARTQMQFQLGNRQIDMIETITLRELPERFDSTYETGGVFNIVRNMFLEREAGRTLWRSDNEFRFSGFMRCMAPFIKGAFKKQSLKYMQDFKAFAEHGIDVRDKA